jgi:hypothetical protein
MAKSSEGGNDLDSLMAYFRGLIAKERDPKVVAQLKARLKAIIEENAGY